MTLCKQKPRYCKILYLDLHKSFLDMYVYLRSDCFPGTDKPICCFWRDKHERTKKVEWAAWGRWQQKQITIRVRELNSPVASFPHCITQMSACFSCRKPAVVPSGLMFLAVTLHCPFLTLFSLSTHLASLFYQEPTRTVMMSIAKWHIRCHGLMIYLML